MIIIMKRSGNSIKAHLTSQNVPRKNNMATP